MVIHRRSTKSTLMKYRYQLKIHWRPSGDLQEISDALPINWRSLGLLDLSRFTIDQTEINLKILGDIPEINRRFIEDPPEIYLRLSRDAWV